MNAGARQSFRANTEHRAIETDWFKRSFSEFYPIIYAHRSVEAAGPEARFAFRVLQIQPGETVLDLACGAGRHVAHLIRNGAKVTGLDYSQDLLDKARDQVPGARFVRGDMRYLPFSSSFDIALNFFTSFGYFIEERENQLVIAELARVLKPDGRFLFDHLNAVSLQANLEAHSSRTAEGYEVHEERWIDERRRVNKRTHVWKEGREAAVFEESVQLYTAGEFCLLLREAGLDVLEMYGDYDGSALDDAAPRMIAAGRKRAPR